MFNNSYQLGNGEERARKYPGTFEIPEKEKRHYLNTGDSAKLIFMAKDGEASERMWVRVTGRTGSTYRGVLDSDPIVLTSLKANDVVKFSPRHVIEIYKSN